MQNPFIVPEWVARWEEKIMKNKKKGAKNRNMRSGLSPKSDPWCDISSRFDSAPTQITVMKGTRGHVFFFSYVSHNRAIAMNGNETVWDYNTCSAHKLLFLPTITSCFSTMKSIFSPTLCDWDFSLGNISTRISCILNPFNRTIGYSNRLPIA